MLDSSYIGKWFHVQSYKHDGSLHRTWDSAMIVDVTDDYIVIASTCNKVVEADGRHWYTREPAVSVFFFNDWFNFIAMFKDDEIMYYCNIASPSLIDKNCIKYIDYDLDLKLLPNKSIIQLDSKEYEFHRKKYVYSDELDYVIKGANEYAKELMRRGGFPFDDALMRDYYAKYLVIKENQEKNIIK
ncbi:MAG: DUF402 domain-containing protein [Bacillales bacterium]|nr:DUF402 domain-containing protein [Bacillales bacterium]